MFHQYNVLLKRYPFRMNMLTTGILFGTGDVIAQHFFPHIDDNGRKDPFDYLRTLRAWTYGTFFFSPIAVVWYSKTLPKINNPLIPLSRRKVWSPKTTNYFDSLYRVGLDQLFFPPLIWIPMYNIVMTCLALHENPLQLAYEKLERNWWHVLRTSWTYWPVYQLISFTFIPVHLRIVFSNIGSVFWNCFLSSVHNSKTHYRSKILEEIHELDDSQVNYS